MEVKKLIGEATEYDKKLLLEEKKPKSWCKSVSAFANTFGGSLIFGVSNDGEIVGLQDPDGDAEKISEIIKTRLDPIPEYRLRFHDEAGKILVILDVVKGEETPYYYSGDGVLEAYVRMGNESVKATATELKRLVLRGKNTSYAFHWSRKITTNSAVMQKSIPFSSKGMSCPRIPPKHAPIIHDIRENNAVTAIVK